MQARLAELGEVKRRVAELDERVDFAERLLARTGAHLCDGGDFAQGGAKETGDPIAE